MSDKQVGVGFNGEAFNVKVPFFLNSIVKSAPDRAWDPQKKVWVLPYNKPNCEHIRRNFERHWLSEKAQAAVEAIPAEANYGFFPAGWAWTAEPMDHQTDAVRFAFPKENFALFHEMGLGKTYTWINVASARWNLNQIDAVLVIAPTSIKAVWAAEFQKFGVEVAPPVVHVHEAGGDKKTQEFIDDTSGGMKVLCVGVESLSSSPAKRTGKGKDYTLHHSNAGKLAKRFCQTRRVMCVVDESSTIKNHKALRTELAWDIGKECVFRSVGTGTSVTQGLQDLYAQFRFLNWEIIGHKSFFTFRNRYCVTEPVPGARGNAVRIVGYQNIEELMDKIRPHVHQRLKKDCLDLPPKTYQNRVAPATAEQKKAAKALKTTLMAEFKGKKLSVSMALDALLRFQQISGGWMPYLDYEDDKGKKHYNVQPFDKNPKMDALMEEIERLPLDTQVIIWSKHKYEIKEITKRLNKLYPLNAYSFYGETPKAERANVTEDFQEGKFRFMVANQAVGGMGQTWTAATLVIYYTDTFSYGDRLQSEDRAHRKGQEHPVTYINLMTDMPVEKRVRMVLDNKGDMADFVQGSMAAEDILTEM